MKVFVLILFLFVGFSTILGCTCSNTKNITDEEYNKSLKQVKAIFYGEVIAHGERRFIWGKYNSTPETVSAYLPIKFKVLRAWKGVEFEEIIAETEVSSSCGFIPEVGNKIMVYAYEDKKLNIPYEISQCSQGYFEDDKTKREYGEGKVFEQAQIQQVQQPVGNDSFLAKLWKTITVFFS